MRPQVLSNHALDLVGMRHQIFQRAVLAQPFDGSFRAAFADPRHTIDRVAHQGQIIDDLFRRHAKLGLHTGRIEQFLAHGVVPADTGTDQLHQVLVAGGNQRIHAGGLGLSGQRADDVIGLDTVDRQHRPAGSGDGSMDGFDLGAQVIRHRRAMRLVLGKPFITEGFALGIEDDRLVVCLVVSLQTT